MKVLHIALIVAVLFLVSGTALADDPYVGVYSCTGAPVQGCGACSDFTIESPNQVSVSKDGSQYKFCASGFTAGAFRAQDDDCFTGPITNGVARWSGSDTFEGMTVNAQATVTFGNNNAAMELDGSVSGTCTCNFSLKAVCTK
ncbi:hypothetical protein OAN24_02575 [Pseudodesulfovibrio sp.]|nr:hypothetical protein [Pseudodesulfovibrio sp.]